MVQASQALGVAISSMNPLPNRLSAIAKRNIAGHCGLKQSDLWGVHIFRASLRGDAGELIPSTVVRMELRKPISDAQLYLAFDRQSSLKHLGLLGGGTELERETFWDGLLVQFSGMRASSTSDLMTPGQAHRHWQDANDPTRSRGGAVELFAQKRLMAENRARIGQVLALTGRGEIPSPALLQDWNSHWGQLATLAPELTSIIGKEAAQEYPVIVMEAKRILQRATDAAYAGNASEVRRLAAGEMGKMACKSCHGINSETLGGKLRPTLERRMADFGAPRLFKVGADLWCPTGREAEAQYLAFSVKAGLLLAGAL